MAAEGREGEWEKLKEIMENFDQRLHRNAQKALRRAGEELASDIRTRILDGKEMKPLHGFTIEQKGSSKPLIDDGDLLGSVGVRFVEELAVFVGVNRRAEDGTNIAAIHERENGTRVPVTPKMRAFLHARGFHLKPETTELFIPGRPFVKPAYRDFRERRTAEKLTTELVEETFGDKG
ncbi:MAG: hypothetical protein HYY16_09215 [Planctomycetes bacterium]|nr:hypothetical protein [Planctomycetota bacterium]